MTLDLMSEQTMTPDEMAALCARAYTHSRPWAAHDFADSLDSPHALVAATGHAFVFGLVVAGEAEILALAADPDVQRKGEASRALALFHALAVARGAESAFLEVAARNAPARAFYEAKGYGVSGLRKGYYHLADGGTDDAVIMSRVLP